MYTITYQGKDVFTGTLFNCMAYLTKKLGEVSVMEAMAEGYTICPMLR